MSKITALRFEGEVRISKDGTEFMYVLEAFNNETNKQLLEPLWIGPFKSDVEAEKAGEQTVHKAVKEIQNLMGEVNVIRVTEQNENFH